MADIGDLLQGGAFAAAITALGSLLSYRAATRQSRHVADTAHENHEIEARRVWMEETEQLRRGLIDNLSTVKAEFSAYRLEAEEREDRLRERMNDQDNKIFELRTQLARCLEVHDPPTLGPLLPQVGP